MGGARGVGNPVCPHEELATIVGKCWVIHAFKRWGRESPHEAARPRTAYTHQTRMAIGLQPDFNCFCLRKTIFL
jgi:hypothetical protein